MNFLKLSTMLPSYLKCYTSKFLIIISELQNLERDIHFN